MTQQHNHKKYLDDIKTTVLEFINDLKENIFSKGEATDLAFVEMFFGCMEPAEIMDNVVQNILPNAEQIRNRNLNFFVEQKSKIFQGLPTDRVDHIELLLTLSPEKGGMSEENKDVVWSYFEAMVDIASEYKKKI